METDCQSCIAGEREEIELQAIKANSNARSTKGAFPRETKRNRHNYTGRDHLALLGVSTILIRPFQAPIPWVMIMGFFHGFFPPCIFFEMYSALWRCEWRLSFD
jgi:hypothetical protein